MDGVLSSPSLVSGLAGYITVLALLDTRRELSKRSFRAVPKDSTFTANSNSYTIESCDVANSTSTTLTAGDTGICFLKTSLTISSSTSISSYTTCTMSSRQTIPFDTVLKGSTTKVKDCKLFAEFEACTVLSGTSCPSQAVPSTTLYIKSVSKGQVVNGMVITVGYNYYTLSSCSITSGKGTCTLSGSESVGRWFNV